MVQKLEIFMIKNIISVALPKASRVFEDTSRCWGNRQALLIFVFCGVVYCADPALVKICQTDDNLLRGLCVDRPPNDNFQNASLVSVLITDSNGNSWTWPGNCPNKTSSISLPCFAQNLVHCDQQGRNCFYSENVLCASNTIAGVVYFLKFTANGSNYGATTQGDEPSHGSDNTSSTVWFKWTASVNASVRFSSIGSSFDTAIAVYVSAPWDGIGVTNSFGVMNIANKNLRDTADDVSPNELLYSEVSFPAQEGQTYYLAVGGYGGSQGIVQIEGTVENWEYVSSTSRVNAPSFNLIRRGVVRDAESALHDQFTEVEISSTTSGARIFFTTDGNAPSVIPTLQKPVSWLLQGSTKPFTGSFPICTCVIRAIAVRAGLLNSAITTTPFYTVQALAPQIAPDSGTFDVWVLVTISASESIEPLPQLHDPADPSASVHYTLDGSEPTLASPRYALPLNLSSALNGTVVRARAWMPGLAPSNVTASSPLSIRQRIARPRADLLGEGCEAPPPDPPGTSRPCSSLTMNSSTGLRLVDGANFVSTVSLASTCQTVGAAIEYTVETFAAARVTVQDWTTYAGPVLLGVGQHKVRLRATAPGMAVSGFESVSVTVLHPILNANPGLWTSSAVSPGQYVWYSIAVAGEHPDVTVAVRLIFGQTDLLLAIGDPRPTLSADAGPRGVRRWISAAAAGRGTELTVTSVDLGPISQEGAILYLAIHGASNVRAVFFFKVTIDSSQALPLGHEVRDSVALNSWKYYKIYLGLETFYPRVHIILKLTPPTQVGIKLAYRRGTAPTSLAADGSSVSGTSDGNFHLVADIDEGWNGQGSPQLLFIGVQGFFAMLGMSTFNYTLLITSLSKSSEAGGTAEAGEDLLSCNIVKTAGLNCIARPLELNNTMLTTTVSSLEWQFYSIQANESFLQFKFDILLEPQNNGQLSPDLACLSLYLQRDSFPSWTSFLSFAVSDGYGIIVLSANVAAGHTYVLGVYASCLTYETYKYQLKASIIKLQDPIGSLYGGSLFITTSYRFYFKALPKDSYSFYSLNLVQYQDLRILLSIQSGKSNIYVSTTNPFPTRAKVGVHWSSEITTSTRVVCDIHSLNCNSNLLCSKWVADSTCSTNGLSSEDGTFVDIFTQDLAFKLGTYYIGVYAVTDVNFGIAAYTDFTSTGIELSHTYSQTVTTYSYRYFYVDIIDKYKLLEVRVVNLNLELPNFMTLLVQRGRKPSTSDHLFQSNAEDNNGMIAFSVNSTVGVSDKTGVFPGRYYIMVHFFKPGYVGAIFEHKYTLFTSVDRNLMNQNIEKKSLPSPEVKNTLIDEFWASSPLIAEGESQTISFQGFSWQFRRIFIPVAALELTVQATPVSSEHDMVLFVRRSLKPTLHTFLSSTDTLDGIGKYTIVVSNPVKGSFYYIGVYLKLQIRSAASFSLKTFLTGTLLDSRPILPLESYFVYFENLLPLSYKFYQVSVPPGNPDITIIVTRLAGVTDILATTEDMYPTRSKFSSKPSEKNRGWWKSEEFSGEGKKLIIRNFDEGYKSPAIYFISLFSIDITSFYIIVQIDNPPPNVNLGKVASGEVSVSAFSNFRIVPGRIMSTLYVLVTHRSTIKRGLAVYLKQGSSPTVLDFDAWSGNIAFNGHSYNLQEGMYLVALPQPKPDLLYVAGVLGLDVGLIQGNGRYAFTLQFLADDDVFSAIQKPVIPTMPMYGPASPDPSTFTTLFPDIEIVGSILENSWTYFWLPVAEPTNVTLRVLSSNTEYGVQIFSRAGEFPKQVLGNESLLSRFIYDNCAVLRQAPQHNSFGCGILQGTADSLILTLSRSTIFSSNVSRTGVYIGVYSSRNPAVNRSGVDNISAAKIDGIELANSTSTVFVNASNNTANTSYFSALKSSTDLSNISTISANNTNDTDVQESNRTSFRLLAIRTNRVQPDHFVLRASGSVNGSLSYESNSARPALFFNVSISSFSQAAFICKVTTFRGAVNMFVSSSEVYPSALSTHSKLRSEAIAGNPVIYHAAEGASLYIGIWLASMSWNAYFKLEMLVIKKPLVLHSINQVYRGNLTVSVPLLFLASMNSTSFEIPAFVHQGRPMRAILLPSLPTCNKEFCFTKECCFGFNPFSSFSLHLTKGVPNLLGSDVTIASVIYPNSFCNLYITCLPDVTNSLRPPSGCESRCFKQSNKFVCCSLYTGYEIEWTPGGANTTLSESWFLTVKASERLDRYTNTFLLNISSPGGSGTSKYSSADGVEDASTLVDGFVPSDISCNLDPTAANFPNQRESWPLVLNHQTRDRLQRVQTDFKEINDSEVVGEVHYGRWKLYRYKSKLEGNVTITLRQTLGGGQGLRLIAQLGPRPDFDSLSHMISELDYKILNGISYETNSYQGQNSTQSNLSVFTVAAEKPPIQELSQVSVLMNITSGGPGERVEGIATLDVSLHSLSSLWIVVYGASPLFDPCTYTLHFDYRATPLHQQILEVRANTILDGALFQDQTMIFVTDAIPLNNDVGIRLTAKSAINYGICGFGLNDGTPCTRAQTISSWNGLGDGTRQGYSDQALNVCSGCQVYSGFEYSGLQQQINSPMGVLRNVIDFDTLQVISSECTNSDGTKIYNTPLSLATFPFYIIVDSLDSKSFAGTCIDFLVPVIVPASSQIVIFNETVVSFSECCSKCNLEATCTYWSYLPDTRACWQCVDQDITYPSLSTVPLPGRNPIYFQKNSTPPNSSWWNAPEGKCTQVMAAQGKCPSPERRLTKGPKCNLVPGNCCLMSNMTTTNAELSLLNTRSKAISGSVSRCVRSNSGSLELDVTQRDNKCNATLQYATAISSSAVVDNRQQWQISPLSPMQSSICLVKNGTACLLESGPWYNQIISLNAFDEVGQRRCLGAILNQGSYSLQLFSCTFPDDAKTSKYLSSVSYPPKAIIKWRIQSRNSSSAEAFQLHLVLPNATNVSICLLFSGEGQLDVADCNPQRIASWNWSVDTGKIEFVSVQSNPKSRRILCITAFPLCSSNKINWGEGCSLTSPSFPSIYPCFSADNIGDGEIEILASDVTNGTSLSLKVTAILNSLFSLKYWTEPAPQSLAPGQTYGGSVGINNSVAFYRFYVKDPGASLLILIRPKLNLVLTHPLLLVEARHGLCSSQSLGLLSNWTLNGAILMLSREVSSRTIAWCISVRLNFSAYSRLKSEASIKTNLETNSNASNYLDSDVPFVLQLWQDAALTTFAHALAMLSSLKKEFSGSSTVSSALPGRRPEVYSLKTGSSISLNVYYRSDTIFGTQWSDRKRNSYGIWVSILPHIPVLLNVNTSSSCSSCSIGVCFRRSLENSDDCLNQLHISSWPELVREVISSPGNQANLSITLRSGSTWPPIYISMYILNKTSMSSVAPYLKPNMTLTLSSSLKQPQPVPFGWSPAWESNSIQYINISLTPGEGQYWVLTSDGPRPVGKWEYFVKFVVMQGEIDVILSFKDVYPSRDSPEKDLRSVGVHDEGEIIVPSAEDQTVFAAVIARGGERIGASMLLAFFRRPYPTSVTYGRWYSVHLAGSAGSVQYFLLDGFGASGQSVQVSLERWPNEPDQNMQNSSGCPIALTINIDSYPTPSSFHGYAALVESTEQMRKTYVDVFGRAQYGIMHASTLVPYNGFGTRLVIGISRCTQGYMGSGNNCTDLNECSATEGVRKTSDLQRICIAPRVCWNYPGYWNCTLTNANNLSAISSFAAVGVEETMKKCSARFRFDSL